MLSWSNINQIINLTDFLLIFFKKCVGDLLSDYNEFGGKTQGLRGIRKHFLKLGSDKK